MSETEHIDNTEGIGDIPCGTVTDFPSTVSEMSAWAGLEVMKVREARRGSGMGVKRQLVSGRNR